MTQSSGHSLLTRLMHNLGWLLGGQGLAGLFGIIFLAIAARTLGPARFGLFTLALTYGQLFSNLSHFESWKGVIRFGALHLAERRREQLARLLGFSATLDWASAILGAGSATALAFLIGPLIHWSPELQRQAAVFAAALVVASGGTPTGMLRLFDRFDLLAFSEAFAPVVRTIGALAAWLTGGGVTAFLIAWAVGAMIQLVVTWIAAISAQKGRLAIGPRAFRLALIENEGLWQFMWQTSATSSLRFLSMQAGTLAVGTVAGPAMAGGFRLSDRIASASAKPTEQLARVIYPELAHLVASNDRQLLRKLFIRGAMIGLGLGLMLVSLALFAGRLILRLIAGPQFTFAQPFLVVLAIAAAIDLSSFILEPFHNAHGAAALVLRARILGTSIYALALIILLPLVGAMGAAIAAAISSGCIAGLLALDARKSLRA